MRKLVSLPADLVWDLSVPAPAKGLYLVLVGFGEREEAAAEAISVSLRDLLVPAGWKDPKTLRRWLAVLEKTGWIRAEEDGARLRISLTTPREQALARATERLGTAKFKGEALMREWLTLLVDRDDYEDNARPPFLRNPLTGQVMEYDRFYPPAVAFEFNGPQHYGTTEQFPDRREARMREALDAIKLGLSVRHGVQVIVVHPQDLTLGGMRGKIEGILPVRQVPEGDPVAQYLGKVSTAYMRACRRRSPCRVSAGDKV